MLDLGLAAWLSGGKAEADKEAWFEEAEREGLEELPAPAIAGAPDAAAGNTDVKAAWERLTALTRREPPVPDDAAYEVVDLLGEEP